MRSKIYNWILSQDYFGHSVQLNFNKRGSEHATIGGGLVSLGVKIIMGVYIYILIKRMINYEDD